MKLIKYYKLFFVTLLLMSFFVILPTDSQAQVPFTGTFGNYDCGDSGAPWNVGYGIPKSTGDTLLNRSSNFRCRVSPSKNTYVRIRTVNSVNASCSGRDSGSAYVGDRSDSSQSYGCAICPIGQTCSRPRDCEDNFDNDGYECMEVNPFNKPANTDCVIFHCPAGVFSVDTGQYTYDVDYTCCRTVSASTDPCDYCIDGESCCPAINNGQLCVPDELCDDDPTGLPDPCNPCPREEKCCYGTYGNKFYDGKTCVKSSICDGASSVEGPPPPPPNPCDNCDKGYDCCPEFGQKCVSEKLCKEGTPTGGKTCTDSIDCLPGEECCEWLGDICVDPADCKIGDPPYIPPRNPSGNSVVITGKTSVTGSGLSSTAGSISTVSFNLTTCCSAIVRPLSRNTRTGVVADHYTLNDIIQSAINIYECILCIVGALMLIMTIVGSTMLILSGGSVDKITLGKKIIVGAVVGGIIAFSTYLVIYWTVTALGANFISPYSAPSDSGSLQVSPGSATNVKEIIK